MLSSILMLLLAAELPRILIDTRYTPAACDVTITSATNLQTTINNATCGQTICLTAGDTWTGNYTLPDKDCTDTTWVVIRTSTPDSSLPQGRRVGPAQASLMAKITSGTGDIFLTDSDADHYRLIGLEVTPSAFVGTIVNLQGGADNLATQTNHITIDRCYIHGHATNGARRGVDANAAYIAVIDSYISDIKEVGADSQAIASWDGTGPIKIYNNYLEAAGENVIFGGAANGAAIFDPADIEIRRNHFFKPTSWWPANPGYTPAYAGTNWQVKNLLELKFASRVLVENNLFENMWTGPQSFAMNFKIDVNGGGDWAWTHDVTFRNNLVRHVSNALALGGAHASSIHTTTDIEYTNNLFYDVGTTWDPGAAGYGWQLGTGLASVDPGTIVHEYSTTLQTGVGFFGSGPEGYENHGLVYRYNIVLDPGSDGDGTDPGLDTLDTWFIDYTYTDTIVQGATCGNYPSGTLCPATVPDIGFVNYAGGNYRLDASSSYDGIGPGGRDLGAHVASAGQSWLDLEVQQSGTSAILRFGRDGLAADATCTVRKGATAVSSTSGGARREVVVTGLTNTQSYYFSVDCGDQDGDIDETLYTAATPSGGDRTIPVQLPAPPAFLTGAARATLDYDDNAALSTPTNTQNTSCGSGCTINLVAPAGVQYYRWRWQTSGDAVLATSAVQPILVQ